MAEIKKINGQNVIDYTSRDYESLLASMRDLIPERMPEWTDHQNEADMGAVLLELFAHMGDVLSYYQDRMANESFLGTAQDRRSVIRHLRLIGYRLSTASPAATVLRLELPADCTDTVTIKRGDAFATKSRDNAPSVRFEYTRETPLKIDASVLPKVGNKKVFDGVPVEEGRLISDEILGVSDGSPNQRYMLAHEGMILRSLGKAQAIYRDIVILTKLDNDIQEWSLRESLNFSRRQERDYIIELDEDDRATVIFGDGDFGALPLKGAEIFATYRVGGGRRGNVGPNTITTIVEAPQLALLGAKTTNQFPAVGGADRESIKEAVDNAPSVFRSLKRAVTAEDYEALARDYKGVGKVRAEASNWNTVKLYVAPVGGGHVNDVLEANLLAYFEDKRMLTSQIEIEDVDYVKIYVTAELGIGSYYSSDAVKAAVRAAVSDLLAFENVDFAQILYLSKFYQAIEAVDGVEYVNITEFRRENPRPGEDMSRGKIELGSNEIPIAPIIEADYQGGVKITLEEEKR